MNDSNPLSVLLKQAIQIVIEDHETLWRNRLASVEERIKRVEKVRGIGVDENGKEDTLKREITTLNSEKMSLEESLQLTTGELLDARDRLEREGERHRTIESRLEELETRVLNALK